MCVCVSECVCVCRIQFYFTNKSQTFPPVSYVTFNGLSAKRHQIRIRYRKKTRTMNINGLIDIVSTEAVIDLQASKQPMLRSKTTYFSFRWILWLLCCLARKPTVAAFFYLWRVAFYMRTNGMFINTFDYHSHVLPFAITPIRMAWKCPIHANGIVFLWNSIMRLTSTKNLIWASIDCVIHLLSILLLTSS